MVTCPACGAKIEADFGMTTCSSCELVFMVDIHGNASDPAASFEETPEEPQDLEASGATADDGDAAPAFESNDYSSSEPADPGTDSEPLSFDDAGAESFGEALGSESSNEGSAEFDTESQGSTQDEASDEVQEEPTGYSEDFLNTLDGSEPVKDDSKDPLGVTAFDGNEASQMADGPFYYDVIISGIDTAHLKQQVIDALSDKRLNWSADEIKKKIKMGQLNLANLNPVKAVLTVLKIQPLDVDVEWSQRPFTAEPGDGKNQEA